MKERQEKHLHIQAVVGEELLALEDVPGGENGGQEPVAWVAEVRELTVCAEAVVDLGGNSLCNYLLLVCDSPCGQG